jgi:hypothetical protein
MGILPRIEQPWILVETGVEDVEDGAGEKNLNGSRH